MWPFRRKPRTGMLPAFRRAYFRSIYGPWWHWRRWFKKPSPAHIQRMKDAMSQRSEGIYGYWDPAIHMEYRHHEP